MPDSIDVDSVRLDCPACQSVLHFNNAGAALSPQPVLQVMLDYLQLEQRIGAYEAARQESHRLDRFYAELAILLHCRPDEIAFMENATRAWDMALYAIDWREGDEILTGQNEYASNYLGLLHLARKTGVRIRVIPCDDQGLIDLDALRGAISSRSRAIALTHIASQRGDIQAAQEVGVLAQQHGLLYLLDACQSAGQLQLDVDTLGCDFLSGTGRKYLRGPRGTGFLYVRKSRLAELDPVFIDLHAADWLSATDYQWQPGARRFENFERSMAGQLALGEAVAYANSLGPGKIEARIHGLAGLLREGLASQAGIEVLEKSSSYSGIVTFSSYHEEASLLQQRLQAAGINTSVARHSNARLDLAREDLTTINRASVHYYNTEQEVWRFVDCVAGKD